VGSNEGLLLSTLSGVGEFSADVSLFVPRGLRTDSISFFANLATTLEDEFIVWLATNLAAWMLNREWSAFHPNSLVLDSHS
jgi:hypothetical protein